MFFDKFEKINEPLTYSIMKDHEDGKSIIAHSLINANDKVENIVLTTTAGLQIDFGIERNFS